ncbi:hypothetical protein AX17_006926 [Amanita inopinata Kibby_2008]|nr:hypothetical protein AX17_006926 [Amanita inopinata Kibby_2008]
MRSLPYILTIACFSATVAGSALQVVPPASQGKAFSTGPTIESQNRITNIDQIITTARRVRQKAGATGSNAPPDEPAQAVAVTAMDGTLGASAVPGNGSTPTALEMREDDIAAEGQILPGFTQVFAGTGTGPRDRDASIEGTAFLTYTVVPNSTYNVNACLAFCNRVPGCVFVNLFYEFNNRLLDFVFREHSNLKCAAYADVHTAAEKVNRGGQQSYPPPAPLTFIQQSSGFARTSLVNPPTPRGYQFVFGPINAANIAPGFMGFSFLNRYDVDACARLCNARAPDPVGGACKFFNIWRAVVNNIPTTYTCAMYYLPTDQSTATNRGQGNLQVTFSRGYRRISYVPDGGFEGYNPCPTFCFATSYANWIGTSPRGGVLDATIFKFVPYAHSGHSVGILGSANGHDNLPGTLAPRNPLGTSRGRRYAITFFHESSFSGPVLEANAFVDIMWNGRAIATIRPGFQRWTYYTFPVVAIGNDRLAFHGGKAPSWDFIDDVYVFLA